MANYFGTDYSETTSGSYYNDLMYGYGGNDYLYGHGGNDAVLGMDGNDYVSGGSGADYVSGGAGHDFVNGGAGRDTVYGGTGADILSGGYDTSRDDFRFYLGDSPGYTSDADTIQDWNRSYDYIDMPIAGNSSNYYEAPLAATNILQAVYYVEDTGRFQDKDHVFFYNTSTDTGYLLSDLDRNGAFETGVVIRGAGSSYGMSSSDII